MPKQAVAGNHAKVSAQPRLHQRAKEIQEYGTVNPALPLDLEEPVRLEMTEQLNQLLADTMTLRDLYKKYGIKVLICDPLGAYTVHSGADWVLGTDYSSKAQRDPGIRLRPSNLPRPSPRRARRAR